MSSYLNVSGHVNSIYWIYLDQSTVTGLVGSTSSGKTCRGFRITINCSYAGGSGGPYHTFIAKTYTDSYNDTGWIYNAGIDYYTARIRFRRSPLYYNYIYFQWIPTSGWDTSSGVKWTTFTAYYKPVYQ